MNIFKVNFVFAVLITSSSVFASDASGNHVGWISMGVPSYYHVGSDGRLIITGDNPGRCAGVTPRYFRVDMGKPYSKEFYAMLLSASANGSSVDCVVASGCGSSDVWVEYCRADLGD